MFCEEDQDDTEFVEEDCAVGGIKQYRYESYELYLDDEVLHVNAVILSPDKIL